LLYGAPLDALHLGCVYYIYMTVSSITLQSAFFSRAWHSSKHRVVIYASSSSKCSTVMNSGPLCRHRELRSSYIVSPLLLPLGAVTAVIQTVRVGRSPILYCTRLIGFEAQLRQRRLWTVWLACLKIIAYSKTKPKPGLSCSKLL